MNAVPPFLADCISKYNLQGKTIIPFATAGGSPISNSLDSLKKVIGTAEIKLPYGYVRSGQKDDFERWITEVKNSAEK